jgi:MerR family transcriptional regulator, light-induced transcriptional regulator
MKMYNINSVSKMTGISAFVIRAWERRYNAVIPGRTGTNRRFYTEEDIEKLRLLKEAVSRGNSIGNIANLSVSSLKEMLTSLRNGEEVKPEGFDQKTAEEFLLKCMEAIKKLEYRNLENYLMRASIEFSHPQLIEGIIIPILNEIGNSWQQGYLRVAQEHLASAVIRTFLYNLRDSYKPGEYSPRIMITTPIGQQHEFGALIASIIAASEGWDAVYFGPDLPASEIIATVEQLKPKIIALSLIFITEDEQLGKEIEKLRFLPEGVKLVAGGSGTAYYKNTIEKVKGTILNDFNEFRSFLRNGK